MCIHISDSIKVSIVRFCKQWNVYELNSKVICLNNLFQNSEVLCIGFLWLFFVIRKYTFFPIQYVYCHYLLNFSAIFSYFICFGTNIMIAVSYSMYALWRKVLHFEYRFHISHVPLWIHLSMSHSQVWTWPIWEWGSSINCRVIKPEMCEKHYNYEYYNIYFY